jgi:hypothetical protein
LRYVARHRRNNCDRVMSCSARSEFTVCNIDDGNRRSSPNHSRVVAARTVPIAVSSVKAHLCLGTAMRQCCIRPHSLRIHLGRWTKLFPGGDESSRSRSNPAICLWSLRQSIIFSLFRAATRGNLVGEYVKSMIRRLLSFPQAAAPQATASIFSFYNFHDAANRIQESE